MGVPWESLVKEYRKSLGQKKFPVIKGYGEDFIRFLEKKSEYFPDRTQADNFNRCVGGYFHHSIVEPISRKVEEALKSSSPISEPQIQAITSQVINTAHTWLNKRNRLSNYSSQYHAKIKLKYKGHANTLIKEAFQKLPLTKGDTSLLLEISAKLFYTDIFHDSPSGVVFSGFGDKEIFPAAISYNVEGVLLGKLKYKELVNSKISHQSTGKIIPFAQKDMMASFMEGVHPDYEKLFKACLKSFCENYPKRLIASIPNLTAEQQLTTSKAQIDVGKKMQEIINEELDKFKTKEFVNKIMGAVSVLPKDELAEMAETLVNLTSFKRRMSFADLETVGGPADVAVISKGDGFIWIKRKHYFKAELNYDFFSKSAPSH